MRFKNAGGTRYAFISRVDRDHGDPHPAYEKMGSPLYPTQAQLEKFRESTVLAAPEKHDLKNGELTVEIPADGLAVIEFNSDVCVGRILLSAAFDVIFVSTPVGKQSQRQRTRASATPMHYYPHTCITL